MTIYRTKQRLNVETSKVSVDTDTYLKLNLEGKERLLPPDEINHIVNLGDRFNIERQDSKIYRILGSINPLISNPLFNLTDNQWDDKQTWAGFNKTTFLDSSYPTDNDVFDEGDLTYPKAIKKYLKEVNGWFGYLNPNGGSFCNYIDVEPKRERFSFISDLNPYNLSQHPSDRTPIKNWEITITYPESTDTTHPMVSGDTAGLLLVEAIPVIVSDREMVAFSVGCLHNLNIGDSVTISGTSGYNGKHVIIRTGLNNGDLKGYYFVIDLPPTGLMSANSRMRRVVGSFESIYYFRIFKKIKTTNLPEIKLSDYELYKLAFSNSVYNDELSQFVFNEDIDVSDLKDYLGRPLSELYITIIKTDSDGLFTNVSSGIETPFIPKLVTSDTFNYLRDIPAISRIHNGFGTPFITHNPLENNLNAGSDNLFYGDLVEYNVSEVKETVLAEVAHRFNTKNRETNGTLITQTSINDDGDVVISGGHGYISNLGRQPTLRPLDLGPRQEGYFYNPHSLIKIREFSSYVEQGDETVLGIPDYAEDLGDGRYLWRDLLDIGVNENDIVALDYPFLNGCHYMYQNNVFSLKRQDPFNEWGLFHSRFPSDPIGQRITDKYRTNSEDYVC